MPFYQLPLYQLKLHRCWKNALGQRHSCAYLQMNMLGWFCRVIYLVRSHSISSSFYQHAILPSTISPSLVQLLLKKWQWHSCAHLQTNMLWSFWRVIYLVHGHFISSSFCQHDILPSTISPTLVQLLLKKMLGTVTQLCIPSNEHAIVILKSNVLGARSFHQFIILPTRHFGIYHFPYFSSIEKMLGTVAQLCIPSNEHAMVILKSNLLCTQSFHQLITLPTCHFTYYHHVQHYYLLSY